MGVEEEVGCSMSDGGDMEEEYWVRGDVRGRGGEVGGWSIIKYDSARMEHFEHSTTIGNNVMNEDGIEDF